MGAGPVALYGLRRRSALERPEWWKMKADRGQIVEIGSIFEIDPDMVSRYRKKPHSQAQCRQQVLTLGVNSHDYRLQLKEVEKYQKQYIQFTASAREAIALALRSMVKNHRVSDDRKRCLLPAYMCDSVFLAFLQEGWKITFYHVNQKLEPDWGELLTLADTCRPGLILIHPYYGADTWARGRHMLRAWRAQGICMMEDVTQSYYLECAGSDADYVVGSLRKWYPVPDGGFVAARERLAQEQICIDESFAEKKLEVMMQKWKYLHADADEAAKRRYLQRNRELEAELDGCMQIRAMSHISAAILADTDEAECRRRRTKNDTLLKLGIRRTDQVCPVPYRNSSCGRQEDYAPLYFTIYVKERTRLQQYLSAHGIYAPVLWPVGDANRDCLRDAENSVFGQLLALPMDQRYGRDGMLAVIQAVNAWAALEG